MGRKRGRRTKSSRARDLRRVRGGGTVDWPGLTGPSVYTFEGQVEQLGAVSRNLSGQRGRRAESARVLFAFLFPPAGIALLIRMLYRWVRGRQ